MHERQLGLFVEGLSARSPDPAIVQAAHASVLGQTEGNHNSLSDTLHFESAICSSIYMKLIKVASLLILRRKED